MSAARVITMADLPPEAQEIERAKRDPVKQAEAREAWAAWAAEEPELFRGYTPPGPRTFREEIEAETCWPWDTAAEGA